MKANVLWIHRSGEVIGLEQGRSIPFGYVRNNAYRFPTAESVTIMWENGMMEDVTVKQSWIDKPGTGYFHD